MDVGPRNSRKSFPKRFATSPRKSTLISTRISTLMCKSISPRSYSNLEQPSKRTSRSLRLSELISNCSMLIRSSSWRARTRSIQELVSGRVSTAWSTSSSASASRVWTSWSSKSSVGSNLTRKSNSHSCINYLDSRMPRRASSPKWPSEEGERIDNLDNI